MTWPVTPLPATARAILLLPAGLRALDEDLTVTYPLPRVLPIDAREFDLIHIHHGGECDGETRALYILGGEYLPHGAVAEARHDPDEAHDQ